MPWNIITNYLSQGWAAFIAFAFIPIYVAYLGLDAYGLIGLFTTLQIWFGLLDLGMSPALGREAARYTAGERSISSYMTLMRTIEVLMVFIAAVIFMVFFYAAEWGSENWFNSTEIKTDSVSVALKVMGFVIAIRFLENIYRSTLLGLQKQVIFNLVFVASATVRAVGAWCVLRFIDASIINFFLWQGIVSVVTLLVLLAVTYYHLKPAHAQFSLSSLKGIGGFAGGMILISITSLMLTQFDKLILSGYLPLDEYGGYMLAVSIAALMFLLITPITQAFYPRFCELVAQKKETDLAKNFHTACQLVMVLTSSLAAVLVLNADIFLSVWLSEVDIPIKTSQVLIILLIGNFVNGLLWVPYHTQLAYAWTSLPILGNVFGILVYFSMIYYALPNYGVLGVAYSWLVLALLLFFGTSWLTFRKILKNEKYDFYINGVLKLAIVAFVIAFICKWFWGILIGQYEWIYLAASLATTLVPTILAADRLKDVRSTVLRVINSYRMKMLG